MDALDAALRSADAVSVGPGDRLVIVLRDVADAPGEDGNSIMDHLHAALVEIGLDGRFLILSGDRAEVHVVREGR